VDEPMVGLDPHGHIIVKRMFKEFCEAGSSIFMSTHTLSVAEELCHRIAILDKGEIIAIGTLKELQSKANMESGRLEPIFLKLTEPMSPTS
ncbi:MAG: ABC transporter ATP-binding protein, partial [Nitrospinota bacterium]